VSSSHSFSVIPYPGLRPFETEECDIFFGREKQTDELLQRLQRVRFLAILGPSGCGKSSLIRAGLISALETGFMSDAGSRWRVAWLRPGDHPIGRLVDSLMAPALLGRERGDQDDAPLFLEAALRRGPLGLIEIVQEGGLCTDSNLLVVVDQFEELFRFRAQGDPEEADAFVALLLAAAAQTALPVYVIIAMRSDFLGDCSLFRDLPEAINESTYLIPRLTREQCAIAIAGPPRVFGGEVDPLLVNRLLNDFGPDPDQLPLLQHALMRMWQKRAAAAEGTDQPVTLTVADYEAIGGLSRALSEHADETLCELTAEQQGVAKMIFQRLTGRCLGKRDTRAPARMAEIASAAGVTVSEVGSVVEAFRGSDRSFLTPREGLLTGETLIDIGHESLIRQWKQLASWVEEEADSAAMYARLRETARLWEADEAGLWGNPDLGRVLQWRQRSNPSEGWAVRYGSREAFALAMKFLDASEAEQRVRELQAEKLREQALRAARRLAWIFGTVLVLLAVGAIGYWYSMVRESASYYNKFVKVNGAPKGIGRLTLSQVGKRLWSIKLVKKGWFGPVMRMEAVNSRNEPTVRHAIEPYFDAWEPSQVTPVRWEFVYDTSDRHRVAYEVAYDKRDKRVWTFVYSPEIISPSGPGRNIRIGHYVAADGYPRQTKGFGGGFVEIQYSPEGYETLVVYRNVLRQLRQGRDKAFGRRQKFDALGRVVEMTSVGPNGQPMVDEAGNAGLGKTLDGLGNATKYVATDEKGKVATLKDGWAISKLRYDPASGNPIEIAYFDEAERPTLHKDGYHMVSMAYDDRGNVTEMHYSDLEERPTTDATHCYGLRFDHDSRDNLVRRMCIGIDGHPAPDNRGVAVEEMAYDSEDNKIESAFFNQSHRPVVASEGYSRARNKYDGRGNQTEEAFFGVSGLAVNSKQGFSRHVWKYDAWDNETDSAYFGSNGQPIDTPNENGRSDFAEVTKRYDEYGNLVQAAYFDATGKPTLSADGYAGWKARFDLSGNMIENTYFGTNDQPLSIPDGYAGWRSQFDDFGRETRTEYFQPDGRVVASKQGVAGRTTVYDAHGNRIEKNYFGPDGKPAILKDGKYASWHALYDDRGRQIEIAYYGIDGQKCLTDDGYHEARYRFDGRSNRIEAAYFGVDSRPILDRENGCATTRSRYNERGKVIETDLFGTDGKQILGNHGYARAVYTYNSRDENTETEYLGVSGEPVLAKSGYSVVRRQFDDRGKPIHISFLGPDLKPVMVASTDKGIGGFASVRTTYDDQGNDIDDTYFGSNEQRVMTSEGYWRRTQKFNSRGQLTEIASFDVDGRLAFNAEQFARLAVIYDSRGNLTGISAFGADGRLSATKYGYARVTLKYDDRGNVIEKLYFGADDRPSATKLGYARMTLKYDDRGNVIEKLYFGVDGARVQ